LSALDQQVINDTLAVFNTASIADTIITIRIKMDLFNQLSDEIHVTFVIDRSAPMISDILMTPLWDEAKASMLVTFTTDDICTSKIMLREIGSIEQFVAVSSTYETRNHRIKIDNPPFDGDFEFYIETKNFSSLRSTEDNNGNNYTFSLNKNFNWTEFNKVDWSIPSGFMLDNFTDFDHDGNMEIVISRYDENSAFGPIEIYEFNNGRFELRKKTNITAIPRAAGDVDKDGKSDLLLGLGQYSFLLEAVDSDSFPTNLVWEDTTNFWVAAYTDLDNDGKNEICGRIENEFVLFENNGDNNFTEISRLTNPTTGENRLGVPKIELVDLNNDSIDEIVFGDYDGDLIAYNSSGDNQQFFNILSVGRTLHSNSTEMITSDNDGNIITATHTSENLNFEHEFDARYWSIEFFEGQESTLISTDTINTFGFSATKDFDSGLKFLNFDEKELLFASFFPELFIFEKMDNQWQPVWLNNQARSNTILVSDLDNDGNDEFYFNDGHEIVGYTASQKNRPIAPYIFSANPLDSSRVQLDWSYVENADSYNIYRGAEANELSLLSSTKNIFYIDSTLSTDQKFYYLITTVDSSFEMKESFFSVIDSAQTAIPPKPLSIEFSNEKQLFVHFDQRIFLMDDRPATIKRNIDPTLKADHFSHP